MIWEALVKMWDRWKCAQITPNEGEHYAGHKADLNFDRYVGGFGENQLSMMRSKITCRDLKQKSFGQKFKARGGALMFAPSWLLNFEKRGINVNLITILLTAIKHKSWIKCLYTVLKSLFWIVDGLLKTSLPKFWPNLTQTHPTHLWLNVYRRIRKVLWWYLIN